MERTAIFTIVGILTCASIFVGGQIYQKYYKNDKTEIAQELKSYQGPIENNFKNIGNFEILDKAIEFFNQAGYNCQKDFVFTSKAKIADQFDIDKLNKVMCLFNFESNSIYIRKDVIKDMEKKVAKFNVAELEYSPNFKETIKLYDYFNVNDPAQMSERTILRKLEYAQKVEVFDRIPEDYINFYDYIYSDEYNGSRIAYVADYLLKKGYSKNDVFNIIDASYLAIKDYDKLSVNKIKIPLIIVNIYFKEKHRPTEMERYEIKKTIRINYNQIIRNFDKNFIKINYVKTE